MDGHFERQLRFFVGLYHLINQHLLKKYITKNIVLNIYYF